jgi:Uma2 family endonuclease
VSAEVLGEHGRPWTEDDYLALGETSDRVELFDGGLLVTPAPSPRHQRVSRRLANAFDPAADKAGLEAFEAVNVRLGPGRIPIPDLVLVEPVDVDQPVIDAARVRLIAEIVSPGNPAADRVTKMHYYAQAGIAWYLLVEPEPATATATASLFRLDGDRYVLAATGAPGRPLELTEPVEVTLDPGDWPS